MKIQANPLIISNLYFLGVTYDEVEVVKLVIQGEDTKTIAKCLNIPASTVVFRLSNVLRKLSLRSRYQLIVFCSKLAHQRLDYGTQNINRPN